MYVHTRTHEHVPAHSVLPMQVYSVDSSGDVSGVLHHAWRPEEGEKPPPAVAACVVKLGVGGNLGVDVFKALQQVWVCLCRGGVWMHGWMDVVVWIEEAHLHTQTHIHV